MTPADIEAELRALVTDALEEEKNRMDDDDEDHHHTKNTSSNGNKNSNSSSTTQALSVRRLATALHKAEAQLRTTILQQQQQQQQQSSTSTSTITNQNQDHNDEAEAEETQAKLLAALHRALLPYQTSLRQALSSIYHADSLLSLSLKHAQTQLASSSHAQQRPINILEALRLAHRFRVVSSAPPGWEGGGREGGMFDFLPPHPYMPGNECLVASLLRKEHVENQKEVGRKKKKMREAEAGKKGGKEGGREGGREGGKEAETMELIRQFSGSGSLGGPPPGWQPGQSFAVDVEVLQKLKQQQQQQQQQQQVEKQKEKEKGPGLGKTGGAAAGGGGGGGGGGGRAAPAKPKKQTFMDSSSDEEEGDEEEDEETRE